MYTGVYEFPDVFLFDEIPARYWISNIWTVCNTIRLKAVDFINFLWNNGLYVQFLSQASKKQGEVIPILNPGVTPFW